MSDAPRNTAVVPRMEPRAVGFFSDWYVLVTWPNGEKQKVAGFTSEAHARGWIEHDSKTWLAQGAKSLF